ncbi:WW domain-containing protein WWM1 [Ceratocystis lukuohia]|uniref:WW domain-containing protein WWM1 n=3 Tax=Ceratocystis TaxID=5157 RepID=A0A0F8CRT7_CERFI|nr:WW domain-containing protein WWM1 [Ceratocystis platani]PHH53692.1 hypothetical protein CFIMG_004997RA [Ceratocystis fimbriata CBS 114723]
MADFAPPSGPPPPQEPQVPPGWTARWNDQYKQWFYVNLYTKQSQWEVPREPVYPPNEAPPPGAPPGYVPGHNQPAPSDTKKNPYDTAPSNQEEDDAALARRLQEEENTRFHNTGNPNASGNPYYNDVGANASYHNASSSNTPTPYDATSTANSTPVNGGEEKRGLMGKLFNKASGKHSGAGGAAAAGGLGGLLGSLAGRHNSHSKPSYGGGGGYPQPGYNNGYPPQAYGQPGYGGYPPQGGYYGQAPPKKSGGMGKMGGAALGLGAGVLGGALIAGAIDHEENEAYAEGYMDGQNDDFGGGDFGGGDFDF